jgi:hypothetical protein
MKKSIDSREQKENIVLETFHMKLRESSMLRMFVEEAAALTSLVLFVGMVAVWAQVIPQL